MEKFARVKNVLRTIRRSRFDRDYYVLYDSACVEMIKYVHQSNARFSSTTIIINRVCRSKTPCMAEKKQMNKEHRRIVETIIVRDVPQWSDSYNSTLCVKYVLVLRDPQFMTKTKKHPYNFNLYGKMYLLCYSYLRDFTLIICDVFHLRKLKTLWNQVNKKKTMKQSVTKIVFWTIRSLYGAVVNEKKNI